jgi:hypothetical protein
MKPPVGAVESDDPRNTDPIERRAAERIREVLRLPGFAPERLPDHRREWFPEFLARTYAAAIERQGKYANTADRLKRWEQAVEDMLRHGVVFETILTVWTTLDATAKEERRGEQYHASRWFQMLGSDDIRELLLDAILTPKPSDWRRYATWFGPLAVQATCRATATKYYTEFARWSPILAPDEIALLEGLLDDPEPRVCWSAAMSLAGPTPGSVGEKTAARLAEAIEDRDWIWSSRQHYQDGSKGCHQAAERVAKLGVAGRVALPAILRLVADEEHGRTWEQVLERVRDAARRLGNAGASYR